MSINIVEAKDVKVGRGGKTKGEKYGKYAIAIQDTLPWIRNQIEKSPDGMIRVRTKDVGIAMGGEFVKKDEGSIYWGLKYILFQEGIVVLGGTHSNGDKLLVMRLANDDDVLPDSLAKYLESNGEDKGKDEDENEEDEDENEEDIQDEEEK